MNSSEKIFEEFKINTKLQKKRKTNKRRKSPLKKFIDEDSKTEYTSINLDSPNKNSPENENQKKFYDEKEFEK